MIEAIGPKQDILPRKFVTKDAKLIDVEHEKNYDVYRYNAKASNDKKIMVGFLSAIFPGLGQAFNDQWKKSVALGGATAAFLYFGTQAMSIFSLLGDKKKSKVSDILMKVAIFGAYVLNIIDAVKNAKSEVYVVQPKQDNTSTKVDVNISQ